MNGASTAVYDVYHVRNLGLPTRGDPQGDRVSIVVRGKESLLQGEVKQVGVF